MKLNEIINEAVVVEVRSEVVNLLSESIIEFFGSTLAKLKAKHPEEVFSDQNPSRVSLEDVAKMITALKIISNKDYRSVMTADDIGINPQSAREIYSLLDSVKKDGKNEKKTKDVFDSLASLAPSIYRNEMKELQGLKQDDDEVRKKSIQKLEAFMLKASQLFQKLKTGTSPVPA